MHVAHCTKALKKTWPFVFCQSFINSSLKNLYTRTLGVHNKKITRLFSGKSPTVFVLTLTIDSKHTHVDDQAKILPMYINCVPLLMSNKIIILPIKWQLE